MIEQVEHSEPHLYLVLLAVKWQPEFLEHLNIERIKTPESLVVSWADKLASFVHNGVRKSSVNIPNRHHYELPGRVELSPCQEAIGRVKRYEAASVCPDYRLRVVSEEWLKSLRSPVAFDRT